MSIDRLNERLDQIASRVPVVRGRGEEATKQALVLPMLDALGFDIWNPLEVCPEYDADFATRKGSQKERVDLAVLLDGTPRIFVEVKSIDTVLDGNEGQLARYFNASPTVSLAVITNGVEYRFYTDTGEPNLMDAQPFYTLRLDTLERNLDVLARFHKSVFSPTAIRDYATDLNYTWKMVQHLKAELDLRNREPSDAFVRWILASERMYDGRVTGGVVERFRPIVKNALHMVLRDVVRRSVAALDEGVVAAPAAEPAPSPAAPPPAAPVETDDPKLKSQTTEQELAAYAAARQVFARSPFANAQIFDASSRKDVPIELLYKDTTGYFGIYLNKPGWWVIRVVFSKTSWVGFNLPADVGEPLVPRDFTVLGPTPFSQFRVEIKSPEDLLKLSALCNAAFRACIEERASTR
ncbi:type I restriction enzyme HsdR N-terminal domain-containing protein [Myxococcota bacterium]|nr:type I restriction enzyme HsdR N-terminal domain-containing protein [Myxococcota bacterium]